MQRLLLPLFASTIVCVAGCSSGNDSLPPQVAAAVEKLQSGDARTRQKAARSLGFLGDKRAIGPLEQALDDENLSVKYTAVTSLEKLGWEPATDRQRLVVILAHRKWEDITSLGKKGIDPLVELLGTKLNELEVGVSRGPSGPPNFKSIEPEAYRYEAEQEIMAQLVRIGEPAVERLLEELANGPPKGRELSAEVLGKIKNPSALPALIGALDDEAPEVRRSAARALGEYADASAIDALTITLNENEDNSTRVLAAQALALIGQPKSTASLTNVMVDPKQPHTVRAATVWALVRLDARGSIPQMKSSLEEAGKAGQYDLTSWLVWALHKFGEEVRDPRSTTVSPRN